MNDTGSGSVSAYQKVQSLNNDAAESTPSGR